MSFDPSTTRSLRSFGWLAGLPVLGLLWAAATSVVAPVVSDSISAAATIVSRESGCGYGSHDAWLKLDVKGRDVAALGEAPDPDRKVTALARLALLPGLRRLTDRTGTVEEASPFIWKAALAEKGGFTLTGNRPAEFSAAEVAAPLTALLGPGTRFIDETRAARGAPFEFPEGAAFAVERLRGLKPGAVATLTDTVLSFEGEAASAEAYAAFHAALAKPPNGFSLGRVEIAPPGVGDFHFGVERRSDGGTVLNGHVASEAVRSEIRAAATRIAAGAPVEDRMQTASGLPASVDASALGRFGLRLANLVDDGAVRFERGALSVSGRAIDAQAVGEAEALMRDERPAGIAAGAVALTSRPVSPYRLRVRREADSVVLSGHLPDRGARESLLSALRTRFVREAIEDRTRTARGAPPDLVAAVTAGIGPLSTLAAGEVAVSDRSLRLSGESLYSESARRLSASLPQAMPTGWIPSVSVALRDASERSDAPTCARLFAERIASHPLRFAPGSSELSPEFYPVLDALADLAKRCPSQRVEVAGHADPAGAAPAHVKALPEYTASLKEPADKATKPAKDAKTAPTPAKGAAAKAPAAKPEPKVEPKTDIKSEAKPAEPAPEPLPDLSQQRALAIVDYLRKAGLPADRAVAAQGAQPGPERRAIGLALRS